MTPSALVATAFLLGAFVITAGLYGFCLVISVVTERAGIRLAGYVFYALHVTIMLTVVVVTPLYFWWKILIATSTVAYLVIPPLTLRHLGRIHRSEEARHDSKSARRLARALVSVGRSP